MTTPNKTASPKPKATAAKAQAATKANAADKAIEPQATNDASVQTNVSAQVESHYQAVPQPTEPMKDETQATQTNEQAKTTSEIDPSADQAGAVDGQANSQSADLGLVLQSSADKQIKAATDAESSNDIGSDMLVLEVKAKKPKKSFWRCGRCWPAEGIQVFVVDDVEKAESDSDHRDDKWDVFISKQEHERLLNEPWLEVSTVEL